jgi:hypothetical protein
VMVTLPGESWDTAGGASGEGSKHEGTEDGGLHVCYRLGMSRNLVVSNVCATDDLTAVVAHMKPWSPRCSWLLVC